MIFAMSFEGVLKSGRSNLSSDSPVECVTFVPGDRGRFCLARAPCPDRVWQARTVFRSEFRYVSIANCMQGQDELTLKPCFGAGSIRPEVYTACQFLSSFHSLAIADREVRPMLNSQSKNTFKVVVEGDCRAFFLEVCRFHLRSVSSHSGDDSGEAQNIRCQGNEAIESP